MTSKRIKTALELALLVGLTWGVFRGAIRNPFTFDDNLFLLSPQVAEPGDPLYLLKPTQTRQLTYLTFYWNYRIGKTNPAGYHLVNVLLHLLNALGVYLFVRLLIRSSPELENEVIRTWLPVAAAGIFALHPLQTEPVNYIYQRSTLLATLFALAAMCAYLASTRRRTPFLVLAATFWILALASKESAVILPLVLVVWLWSRSKGAETVRDRLRRAPGLASAVILSASAGIAWAIYTLRHHSWTAGGAEAMTQSGYMVAQAQVLASYLRILFWPAGLSVDHDFRPAAPLSPYGIYCFLLLAVLITIGIRIRKSAPTLSFLVLSFLVLLAPTSSIVPSADFMFEHRMYLPMIAGSVLMAWGLFAALGVLVRAPQTRRVLSLAALGILLAGYATLSTMRTSTWANNLLLWSDAAKHAPGKARVRYNLGVAYLSISPQKARQEFLEAVHLKPDHAAALYNLGWLDQIQGRFDSARGHYLAAIQADANHWQAHQNLANLDLLSGRVRDAIREYQKTIELHPDYWPAYQTLAGLQIRGGSASEALAVLRKLKELRPELLEARYLNACALIEVRRYSEARGELDFIAARDSAGAYKSRIAELSQKMRRRSRS